MGIEYSLYELTPKYQLNRFKVGQYCGVLFKVDGQYFVDYFPWVQFGDLGVKDLLEKIHKDGELPDFLQQCLSLDKMRFELDHWDFLNHTLYNDERVQNPVLKIKYIDGFNEINEILESTPSKLRIDFNNGGSSKKILCWWNSLSEKHKEKIEFLEDPLSFDEEKNTYLRKIGISLAADRNIFQQEFYDYNILKPNVDIVNSIPNNSIFSSYMGHDLGRYHCFLALMKWGNLSLAHGINTPGIYNEQLDIFNQNGMHTNIAPMVIKQLYTQIKGAKWQTLI
jgi:hypothetical protein